MKCTECKKEIVGEPVFLWTRVFCAKCGLKLARKLMGMKE